MSDIDARLDAARQHLATARANEQRALISARDVALEAVGAGRSYRSTATRLGIDPMTVRKWWNES